MVIVITMAGLGSRFKEIGFNEPKYKIKAHGKTLFEWSMDSLIGYNKNVSKYYFIVRVEDNSSDFIKQKVARYGITNIEIIEIDYLTDGQATTAILAGETWDKNEELLIYNIDTYVETNQMNYEEIRGDGFIPCFIAEGAHWSFVKLDESGKALEVREKVRVSDNCTLGAYYFKSCALYEQLYNECYEIDGKLEKGERYIAPLYNYLIEKGGSVYISNVPFKTVHVLGTPEELNFFIKNYKL